MSSKKQKPVFSIEEKLATIEWKLQLLKASATATHTPLRTLKSIIQADVILPTQNSLRKIIDSPLRQKR